MKYVICTLTILLCSLAAAWDEVINKSDTFLRTKRDCKTQVSLKTCKNTETNTRVRYYYYMEKVSVQLCKNKKPQKFEWAMTDLSGTDSQFFVNYNYRHTIPIRADSLRVGRYVLYVLVKENGMDAVRDACTIVVEELPLILQFGTSYVSPAKKDQPFNFNVNIINAGKEQVKLDWKITCKPEDKSKCPCDYVKQAQQPKTGQSIMPQKFNLLECTTELNFDVGVSFVRSGDDKMLRYQRRLIAAKNITMNVAITMIRGGLTLGIETPSSAYDVGFGITCTLNCAEFSNITPKWVVRRVGGEQITSGVKVNAKDNKKMTIEANTLKKGVKYETSAEGKSNKNYFITSTQFTTLDYLKSPDCTVNPKEGISLETSFVITCVPKDAHYKKFPPRYQVIEVDSSGKERMLLETANSQFEVLLRGSGSVANVIINAYDKLQKMATRKLPPIKITKKDLTRAGANDLLGIIVVNNNEGNYDKAVILTHNLLDELNESHMTESDKKGVLKQIVGIAKKLKVETAYQYTVLTEIIPSLMAVVGYDEKLRTELGSFCHGVAKIDTNKILFSRNKYVEGRNIRKHADHISECLTFLMKTTTTSTTQVSVVEENVTIPGDYHFITEHIPDYLLPDDDKFSDDVYNSAVNLGNSYLGTMEPGEVISLPLNRAGADDLNWGTALAKDSGNNLAGKSFHVNKVIVTTPPEISNKHKDDIIGLRVCTFKPDFLGAADPRIATNIVDVGYQKFDDTGVHGVPGQLDIKFELLVDKDIYELYNTLVITNIAMAKSALDYKINVHRLNLQKGQKCSVKFILDPKVKLQIVFTMNRRPVIRDFQKSALSVDKDYMAKKRIIPCPFKQNFQSDRFAYMAVIAFSDAPNSVLKMPYNVSFHYQRCVVFNLQSYLWDLATCIVGVRYENETYATIDCHCGHTSLHAAENYQIEHKLDELQQSIYTIQPFVNYNVFIVVAIIFLLYCIIICFYQLRVSHVMSKDRIIFLSDNLKNDRYAYMLVIKTLNTIFAGTTSNVCIQIFGENLMSFPHVLNYPDPDTMLLQRNKIDWYILCTSLYLGNIKYIDLWLDNVGHRPSWHCEDIMITDLQTRETWYFNVNADLSVSSRNKVYIRRYPSQKIYKVGLIEIISNRFNFHLGAENTWNIFSRGNDKKFSFHRRLTVLLSMVYTTYAVIIILMGSPELQNSDAFGEGDFNFHLTALLNAVLTSFFCYLINYPIIFIFRHSTKPENVNSLNIEAAVFTPRFASIAWSFVITWIIICMVYLLIFGFYVTFYSGYVWMFTWLVSILIGIFIMENIALTMGDFFLEKFGKHKKPEFNYTYLFRIIESQRRILFRTFGECLLRPYFEKHYQKLTMADIYEIKERDMEKTLQRYLFREMVLYLIYLITSYSVLMASRDRMLPITNTNMHQIIEGNFNASHMKLESIDNIEKIYDYIQRTIIPTTHGYGWYGKLYVPDPGIMEDFNTKILGVVQIRQQLRKQKCQRPKELRDYQIPCTNKIPNILKESKYYDGAKISSHRGEYGFYGGDGYVVHLGRSFFNALYILTFLRKSHWLCTNTKVVFIEFWTYNVNSDYFNGVRVMIEISSTGRILQSASVYTARLLIHNPILVKIGNVLWIYYHVFLLILLLMQVSVNIQRYRQTYLQILWNYLDIALVIFSISIIIILSMTFYKLDRLFEELEEAESTDFINYFELINFARLDRDILAVITFLATTKLWKFLRFGVVFQVMEIAFQRTLPSYIAAFIYQGIVYITFAFYFHLMFGHMVINFYSTSGAITGIYLSSVNSGKKFNKIRYFRQLYVAFFIWLLFMISAKLFFGFYSTILKQGFKRCKIEFSNKTKPPNIQTYIKEEVEYNCEIWKRRNARARIRLGGGQKSETNCLNVTYKFVTPKQDSQRYADCVTIPASKMELMRLVGICVSMNKLRKHYSSMEIEITEDIFLLLARVTLALRQFRQWQRESYEEIAPPTLFFEVKDVDESMKFIPNSKLLQMEYYVERMFQYKLKGNEVTEERLEQFREKLQDIADVVSNIRLVRERQTV